VLPASLACYPETVIAVHQTEATSGCGTSQRQRTKNFSFVKPTYAHLTYQTIQFLVYLKRDGTRAETRFHLSPKRTSPFKSAGASVQSTAGSLGVRIGFSNAGYTTFRGSVGVLATHSIRQFPLPFPSRASPCAITFQTHSTTCFGGTPSSSESFHQYLHLTRLLSQCISL
jgi:hypothetical protein